MKLFIIDAIGPFFKGYKRKTINWSKIPFYNLENGGKVDLDKFKAIRKDFDKLMKKFSDIGYNAISIDDLAHLVNYDFYPKKLQNKIVQYQQEYKILFQIAKQYGMKIFVNTDIMFFNHSIARHTKKKNSGIIKMLKHACQYVLSEFPVDGIIMRMGEDDSHDFESDFQSKLTIKKPAQLRSFVKNMLPVFEKLNKYLIMRTWTVGVYKIGDLIWNKKTYDKAFKKIKSKNLIISMKFGDTDFYGNLELNPLFFRDHHQKIIELQTRREHDGFGLLPVYTGWDYESYYKKLKKMKNIMGISVWCQTGGWTRWKKLTFLDDSSEWTELNTYSTLKIYKQAYSADKAIDEFFKNKEIKLFLKKYKSISDKILYLPSQKKLYFRRSRIPPQAWVRWDQVNVSYLIEYFYKYLKCHDFEVSQEELAEIYKLGKKLKIKNIDFIFATLRIFYLIRESFTNPNKKIKLVEEILSYAKKYPDSYRFSIQHAKKANFGLKIMLKIFTRKKSKYRLIDKI
ncbi:MAG: glycosyl hydrolase family 67 [Nanoarchaeota archaeon]|nr:glycosyl hydrolase family 67 [Nanoarchaeota archaeon]MBU1597451.1 glycosyl hydrolase family 67 [Nanoarchaeota archaeon]